MAWNSHHLLSLTISLSWEFGSGSDLLMRPQSMSTRAASSEGLTSRIISRGGSFAWLLSGGLNSSLHGLLRGLPECPQGVRIAPLQTIQETEVKPTVPSETSTMPSTRLYWSPSLDVIQHGRDYTGSWTDTRGQDSLGANLETGHPRWLQHWPFQDAFYWCQVFLFSHNTELHSPPPH